MALRESWSGHAMIRTLQRTLSPWRKALSANAYDDRIQVAEEWAKMVHAAAAWSDVAPAGDAEAP